VRSVAVHLNRIIVSGIHGVRGFSWPIPWLMFGTDTLTQMR
jgi:hypothetical protein